MSPTKKTRTKSERPAYERMLKNLRGFEDEDTLNYALRENIPVARGLRRGRARGEAQNNHLTTCGCALRYRQPATTMID